MTDFLLNTFKLQNGKNLLQLSQCFAQLMGLHFAGKNLLVVSSADGDLSQHVACGVVICNFYL